MPRPLPVTGKWPAQQDGEFQENHGEHFGLAIQDALNKWANSSEDQEQTPERPDVHVVLEATITPNPGGIKEYRATITQHP
jgi:hypothetical protein